MIIDIGLAFIDAVFWERRMPFPFLKVFGFKKEA